MEDALAKRYDPYTYESNNGTLKWLIAALAVWIIVALALAWSDQNTRSALIGIQGEGISHVPPSSFTLGGQTEIDALLEFARVENLDCTTQEDFINLVNDCGRLLDIQQRYENPQNTSDLLFPLWIVSMIIVAFPFGTFTHRAGRNLLTLKSSGQRFRPDRAVLWFYIPIMNLIRPWQIYKELFKASDPDVSATDQTEWQRNGDSRPIVVIWSLLIFAVAILNRVTVSRIFARTREDIQDVIDAWRLLVIADLLLVAVGIAGIVIAIELNKRQDARSAKVGPVTVKPPRPEDPMKRALEEGLRRQDQERRGKK